MLIAKVMRGWLPTVHRGGWTGGGSGRVATVAVAEGDEESERGINGDGL